MYFMFINLCIPFIDSIIEFRLIDEISFINKYKKNDNNIYSIINNVVYINNMYNNVLINTINFIFVNITLTTNNVCDNILYTSFDTSPINSSRRDFELIKYYNDQNTTIFEDKYRIKHLFNGSFSIRLNNKYTNPFLYCDIII